MALARVTPETAVETVRDQVLGFRETVEAAGRGPALTKLVQRADALVELVDAATLEIEVLTLGDLHPQWTGMLAQWLDIDPQPLVDVITGEVEDYRNPPDLDRSSAVVRIRKGRQRRGRQAGERVAPILVIARGSTESPGQEWMEGIVDEIKERPLTLIVAPKAADWAHALAGLGSRDTWVCKVVELESLHTKNLAASLNHPPLQQAGRLAGLWSVSSALASMHGAFSTALENEGRSMRSKKASLEQRMAASPGSGGANPTEVLGEVRGYLQKKFEIFSKGASSRMGELVATHDGTLTTELNATIDAFEDFDYEKKPKLFVLTIPREVTDGLLERASKVLLEAGKGDLVKMGELFKESERHLEQLIESKGAPPVKLHFEHMSERALTNIVDRAIGFKRPYQSEITRRGPMDYFMAARRYQMIFFMVFSAFGLSFIRSYQAFTIPAGVVLLSIGLLNVVNSARKQSAETIAKELDKARDGMRSDLLRSTSEVQKTWDQAISAHLSEQQTNALELVETTVKSVTDQVVREAAADKEILQKQLKTLDASQRKVAEGVKKSEAAATDLQHLSDQLIVFYTSMINPAEDAAAPGVPGVPGAAMPGAPAAGLPGAAKLPTPGGAGAVPKEAADALKKLEELKQAKPGSAGASKAGAAGKAADSKGEDPFQKLREAKKAAVKRPSLKPRPGKPSASKSRPTPPPPRSKDRG